MARVFNDRLKKLNLNLESIYLVVLFCCVSLFNYSTIIFNEVVNVIHLCLEYLIFALIALITLIKLYQHNKNTKILAGVVFLWGLLVLICSKNDRMITISVLIFSLMDCDKEEFLKKAYQGLLITFLLMICVYASGLLGYEFHTRGFVVRDTMGFVSATISSSILLFIILLGIYISKNRLSILNITIYLVGALALYLLTDTRVSFLLSVVAVLSTFLLKLNYSKTTKKWMQWLCVSVPVLVLGVTAVLTILQRYDMPLIDKINEILSGRLYLNNRALSVEGLSLFGKEIVWADSGVYYGIDMCFPHILFNYGLVSLVVVYLYVILYTKHEVNKFNIYMMLVFTMITIGSFVEPYWINYQYNPFILMAGTTTIKINRMDYTALTFRREMVRR